MREAICSCNGDHVPNLVGAGRTSDFLFDPWLSSLPLSRGSTFVNAECGESAWISDLLYFEEGSWHPDQVAQLFGPDLTKRALAITVPT